MEYESLSVLCGRAVASSIYKELDTKEHPDENSNYSLDVILIDGREDSRLYVSMKSKKLKSYNIETCVHHFDENVTEQELIQCIKELNYSNNTLGIMIQLPLPPHLDTRKICDTIEPNKDVDGLTSYNIGGIITQNCIYKPCTAEAVMKIIEYYKISTEGKHATILGKSNVIGMPVSILLSQQNATVTMCDIYTEDPKRFTKHPDIIVSATGKPELIDVTWFSNKDCVVIDVGISVKEENGKKVIYGDMQKSLKSIVWKKTPVPGGVGPITISVLVSHCLNAYHKIVEKKKQDMNVILNIPEDQLKKCLHQFC